VKEVTEEVAKSEACELMLNTAAPKPSPTESPETSQPPILRVWNKLVTGLEKRYQRPTGGWGAYVDMAQWASGTLQAANQVKDSVENGTTDVTLFARPGVNRAAMAYARMCHPVPKLP
jgi:hypothetical protein